MQMRSLLHRHSTEGGERAGVIGAAVGGGGVRCFAEFSRSRLTISLVQRLIEARLEDGV